MTPNRRSYRLSVAIPASLVSEYANIREKTEIIGRIARSAAIFRVEEIVVYQDQPDESSLIKVILGYIETPQYLRKYFYKFRPELQYAGALPPLRTPHHQLEAKAANLSEGEYREGILLDQKGINVVDIGVEIPVQLVGKAPSQGSRITIKIIKTLPDPRCEMVKRREIQTYWGYDIQASKKTLGELTSSGFYDLTIATSRTGIRITEQQELLKAKLAEARNVLVAFGSPRKGIPELLRHDGKSADNHFQFTLNTIPEQGTETVRTEEAAHATLAVLNLFS